jgi:hypothetical protein
MKRTWAISAAVLTATILQAQPVRLHPDNPHYYLFQGKPAVLITSAEHYGGVVNGAFDYVKYFDALKAYGLNYTRIYPGYLFEPVGKFMKGNTLGVKPADLVLPWARSNKPGYVLGGNKFDLDRWNPQFSRRLKDFVAKAAERGIVVEICFFNAHYSDTWPISPLYWENNIQGEGRAEVEDAQTMRNAGLVRREADYVRKITQDVNGFDNVILEICDEPTLNGSPGKEVGPWIKHMIATIKAAEAPLPNKHLIAQQIEEPIGGPVDFSADPDVPVLVTQYLWYSGVQMGGLKGLDYKYDVNKAIDFNETNYYPIWYEGDKIGASRVEAWEFMVGGGSSFNQLNGLFTVDNPAGKTPENEQILTALRSLKQFIESFEFLKMRPDPGLVASGLPRGAFARGMSEPGRQYSLYMHHSTTRWENAYRVQPGNYRATLSLKLAPGSYKADWVDPATGKILNSETFQHDGKTKTLTTPDYSIDIALRIKSSGT